MTSSDGWPRGWHEHRRAQAASGLRLTPAERLRWLEETMATMRRWVGRAAPANARPQPSAREPAATHADGQGGTDVPTGRDDSPGDSEPRNR